jgi:hypothetical protein
MPYRIPEAVPSEAEAAPKPPAPPTATEHCDRVSPADAARWRRLRPAGPGPQAIEQANGNASRPSGFYYF